MKRPTRPANAVLLGVLFALSSEGTLSLGALIASPLGPVLFALSLLAAAAFVKGAAIPFDRWLLGAMVAPTPVSAMLHSATMVKIAPFLILKLSPAIAGTLTGALVGLTGVAVFAAAGFLALSRDAFKEILGYSTIALLGLMSGLAALGGDAAKVAMLLMLFHALSKALLIFAATLGLLAEHPGAALWLPLPILLVMGLPWLLRYMARFERTDEYRCAERGSFDGALFYAPEAQGIRRRLYALFGALFIALGLSGVFA